MCVYMCVCVRVCMRACMQNCNHSPTSPLGPGCLRTACHRHCYLAQDGRWWNPCKAAPAMCVLLTIVWVSIFVLFGWIALLLALVLGAVLTVTVVCAFIQTGHCYCKAVYCCEGPLEHVETSGVQ